MNMQKNNTKVIEKKNIRDSNIEKPLEKKELKLKDGVIIVGLPGVGNVGKAALDFILDNLKLKPRGHMFFPFFPNLVLVRRDNFVEVPHMKVYGDEKRNVGFFVSPFQPAEEGRSFEFSMNIINVAKKIGAKTIITTGGFAKERINSKPKSYFICSNKKSYEGWGKKLVSLGVDEKAAGKIGTIVGASGLVLGLSSRQGLDSFTILVETGIDPSEVDFKSARALAEILDKLLGLKVDIKDFDKKMKERMKLMKKEKTIDPELARLIQREAGMGANDEEEANYLG